MAEILKKIGRAGATVALVGTGVGAGIAYDRMSSSAAASGDTSHNPDSTLKLNGGLPSADALQDLLTRLQGDESKLSADEAALKAVQDKITALTAVPELPKVFQGDQMQVDGFPTSASHVDVAKGVFKNKIGLGSEMAIAEPGVLHVGPDFGDPRSSNPNKTLDGKTNDGWATMDKSDGSIQPFNPTNQFVPHEVDPKTGDGLPVQQIIPEGGFVYISGGHMDLTFGTDGKYKVHLPEITQDPAGNKVKNTYQVYIRGFYGDNKQDTDKNSRLVVERFVAGAIEIERYDARNQTNAAFVSEGQFLQKVRDAHSTFTNAGDGGSSLVTAVFIDENTGAYVFIQQKAGRFEDVNDYVQGWNQLDTNWAK